MEIETLVYNDPNTVSVVYWSMYYPNGWRVRKPIEAKWCWKKFGYIYYMDVTRELPKEYKEVVENKSEANIHRHTFRYRDDDGSYHEKVFYAPADYSTVNGHKEWIEEVKIKHKSNKTNIL